MEKVISHSDFLEKAANREKSFLLLYKAGSELSDCAFQNLGKALTGELNVPVYLADVTSVRDIHTQYGITTAPVLLVFEKGTLITVIKGCQESSYYKALTENAIFQLKAREEGRSVKRVTVYSSPTCSWCNTLKAWLRRNSIPFTDVDVSRDEHAAQELVMRTGQQGVPQTDINGQIVIGFNQQRLKELLEI
jgi:glutaredoxin-like YruB-family protein